MVIGIVEDEEQIRVELADLLKRYGHTAKCYTEFDQIAASVQKEIPDLLLLDVNLPYKDGYEICREIREKLSLPIIMLTAQDSAMEEVMALKSGADDFVAKPYHPQVLLAHIEAVAKRVSAQSAKSQITCKGVTLDRTAGVLEYQGEQVELTKNELRILNLLMGHQGEIVSREDIMAELWQDGQFVDENTLNVNIGRLRKKLEALGVEHFLETKRGMGYRI